MSLRSADMQIIIQKSSEVMRNQHQENARARLQQQQIAQQFQNQVEAEGRQVNTLAETYKSQIESKKQKNGKKENKKKKRNKNSPGPDASSSGIDIKI